MKQTVQNAPRLYTPHPLQLRATVTLEAGPAHYLRNVMRRAEGDDVRLFNGRDGEFSARIEKLAKNAAHVLCVQKLLDQPPPPCPIHLLFAPLKKNRMDQVIEKTVELGVTHLHPVITERTEVRSLNTEKVTAQIIEAAEQSGRLDLPTLYPAVDLKTKLMQWDAKTSLFWAAEMEKDSAAALSQALKASAFLIGPVGGFSPREAEFLAAQPFIKPVSLGPRVLRAETAAIVCVVLAKS
jgi:16S rRNA (uracil1498-N3)-methyltransferase